LIGERWSVGSAIVQATAPRVPCFKLGIRMDDEAFPRRFAAALRPGTYLAIVQEGEVAAGDPVDGGHRPAHTAARDPVEVGHRPDHQVDVRTVARAYRGDRRLVPRLLEVPELPPSWREWADAHLPDQPRPRSGCPPGPAQASQKASSWSRLVVKVTSSWRRRASGRPAATRSSRPAHHPARSAKPGAGEGAP